MKQEIVYMFRIWGRTFKNNKMIKNTTVEIDNPEMTRTHKVFKALEDICATSLISIY